MTDTDVQWLAELEQAKDELIQVLTEHQPIKADDLGNYLSTEIGAMAIAYYQLYRAGKIVETADGLCLASQDTRGGA